MSKQKSDAFEPTIEESIMASGLHRQGTFAPPEDPTPSSVSPAPVRAQLRLTIPAGTDFDIQELNESIAALVARIGSEVDVHLDFQVKARKAK